MSKLMLPYLEVSKLVPTILTRVKIGATAFMTISSTAWATFPSLINSILVGISYKDTHTTVFILEII